MIHHIIVSRLIQQCGQQKAERKTSGSIWFWPKICNMHDIHTGIKWECKKWEMRTLERQMQFLYEIIKDPLERIFMKKIQTISDRQNKLHLNTSRMRDEWEANPSFSEIPDCVTCKLFQDMQENSNYNIISQNLPANKSKEKYKKNVRGF